MRKTKLLILISSLLIALQSCGSIKDGFRSQKKNSTDEFLVEKKSPLVMPPEYNELPTPKINEDEDNLESKDSSSDIEKLITNNDVKIDNSLKKNENFENSIIDQIKKN